MMMSVRILSRSLLLAVMVGCSLTKEYVNGDPEVPCYFVFGDSLSDPGNNNDLATSAKANYKPYGIDFDGGKATGRFTNGLTFVDILTGKHLGFNHLIPSFKDALTNQNIINGVNYASGSAGILPETGKLLGAHIGLGQQIQNHRLIVSRITGKTGASAQDHLQKCLYTLNIGSNDYLNNYFIPQFYNTSKKYTPAQFATLLIDQYSQHIKDLHNLGARKFAIYGLGYLGCTLAEIAVFGTNGALCVDKINFAVVLFNSMLVPLIDQLNTKVTDSHFTYINTTSITPTTGFKVVNASCCPVRPSDGQCQPQATTCNNRNDYMFWDYFHPTQSVNEIMAKRAYKAQDPTDVHPMDISCLIKK